MPNTGFFEKDELEGFRDVLHEKLGLHPLRNLFPDEVHEGTGIDVDVEVHSTFAADPVDRGEPSPYAAPNAFRTIRAEPIQLRNARPLSNKEISFFRNLGELGQVSGLSGSQQEKRARKIMDLVRRVMLPVEERKHVMMAEALQGAVTIRIGGVDQTFSYGLNSVNTDPAIGVLDWTDPAATIVQDLYRIQDAFEEAGNVRPDVAVFDKRMFARFFVQNTEFTDYVKENPALSKSFIGFHDADGDLAALKAPSQPFEMFDMTWIPVTGTYIDTQGVTRRRWDVTTISLLAMNAGDGQRVLEWGTNQDEYNPEGSPRMRDWSEMNPISHQVEYSLNGVPIIFIRERAQTVTIEP